MKKSHIMKAVCAVGLSAACVWSLAACTSGDQASGDSGAVAATVGDVPISEDTVTKYIESIRSQMGVTDEDSWGNWLAQNGYTPESVREEVVNSYVQRELIKKGADERGITVDSTEVDGYVDQMKQNYDTDEKWQEALTQAGMTEDEYRSEIELQLKNRGLLESFASDEEPSEEDLLQYAQMYATTYDGAKRSSHILFDSGDEATAREVLDKLNAGELDFAEAAKEYSKDGSASDGGDVGWDKTSSFVEEYQTALDGLEKDQMSGLVTSTYGIHIIKCTDVFTAPEEVTSLDQIPSDWVDSIKSSLKSQKQNEAYQQWLEEYKESSDVVINPMPEGLPYAVDMSKYQTSDDAAAEDGSDEGSDASNESGENADAAADAADGAADGTDAGESTGESSDNAEDAGASADNAANGEGQPAEGAEGSSSLSE
ncbi:peptidylprolyl isomerase [Rubneribacter badeniensis]|uniref:peptidylprolyl isomerase n=1 Tax=Rubneribacter badeniensis TaxID=2070688 RepID=A0A2K2U543_9ACTN|nr:peptidylprolyl isomerase [Rubneribacter badeniensis]OUO93909.1 peptidylprolyl isomerase [Gordonibacter sp. An232A]PNV65362.1 peptidylprolyl isomerase [Rubneribacter badeniensis]CVH79949.1 Foldase protein PrsA 1 precursor [Coriobacteriaceae bacterium CHKCI002]